MKKEEIIYSVKCGAYFTVFLLYSEGWRSIEITAFGHNFNREIGNYDVDFIDKPVRFGYTINEPNLRPVDVLCGNGITVIHMSNDPTIYTSSEDYNETDKLNMVVTESRLVDNKI